MLAQTVSVLFPVVKYHGMLFPALPHVCIGHVFCMKCLTTHLQRFNTCPTCRTPGCTLEGTLKLFPDWKEPSAEEEPNPLSITDLEKLRDTAEEVIAACRNRGPDASHEELVHLISRAEAVILHLKSQVVFKVWIVSV